MLLPDLPEALLHRIVDLAVGGAPGGAPGGGELECAALGQIAATCKALARCCRTALLRPGASPVLTLDLCDPRQSHGRVLRSKALALALAPGGRLRLKLRGPEQVQWVAGVASWLRVANLDLDAGTLSSGQAQRLLDALGEADVRRQLRLRLRLRAGPLDQEQRDPRRRPHLVLRGWRGGTRDLAMDLAMDLANAPSAALTLGEDSLPRLDSFSVSITVALAAGAAAGAGAGAAGAAGAALSRQLRVELDWARPLRELRLRAGPGAFLSLGRAGLADAAQALVAENVVVAPAVRRPLRAACVALAGAHNGLGPAPRLARAVVHNERCLLQLLGHAQTFEALAVARDAVLVLDGPRASESAAMLIE